MNPGDWVTIHMHDTPAGFRIDLNDETTPGGSMTASIDNGFAPRSVHARLRRPARRRRMRSIPSTAPATRGKYVVGAHLQRRVLRRDRPLRALQRVRRGIQLRGRGRPTTRRLDADDVLFSVFQARIPCSSTSTAASPATTTSTGPRTRRTGRGRTPTRRPTSGCTRAGDLHQPDDERTDTTTRRPPSRPTCRDRELLQHRRREPAASTRRRDRSSTRSYSTRKVDGTCAWQEGGAVHPRHDPRLRREPRRRSTAPRCCRRSSRLRGSPR